MPKILTDEEEAFAKWLHDVAVANDIDYMAEGMKGREQEPDTEEVEDVEEG